MIAALNHTQFSKVQEQAIVRLAGLQQPCPVSVPKENLWKEDKCSAPKLSFIRRLHSLIVSEIFTQL